MLGIRRLFRYKVARVPSVRINNASAILISFLFSSLRNGWLVTVRWKPWRSFRVVRLRERSDL